MRRALDVAFRISLALFLAGGVLLVAIQAIGIVAGSGSVISEAATRLGPSTYALASICGVLGFVRGYMEGWTST